MTVLRNFAIAGTAVLALSVTACGDKTVTSAPPSVTTTTSVVAGANAAGGATATASDDSSAAAVPDDTQLNDVDQMLRDIEADLSTADHEATTPEGDPTS